MSAERLAGAGCAERLAGAVAPRGSRGRSRRELAGAVAPRGSRGTGWARGSRGTGWAERLAGRIAPKARGAQGARERAGPACAEGSRGRVRRDAAGGAVRRSFAPVRAPSNVLHPIRAERSTLLPAPPTTDELHLDARSARGGGRGGRAHPAATPAGAPSASSTASAWPAGTSMTARAARQPRSRHGGTSRSTRTGAPRGPSQIRSRGQRIPAVCTERHPASSRPTVAGRARSPPDASPPDAEPPGTSPPGVDPGGAEPSGADPGGARTPESPRSRAAGRAATRRTTSAPSARAGRRARRRVMEGIGRAGEGSPRRPRPTPRPPPPPPTPNHPLTARPPTLIAGADRRSHQG